MCYDELFWISDIFFVREYIKRSKLHIILIVVIIVAAIVVAAATFDA